MPIAEDTSKYPPPFIDYTTAQKSSNESHSSSLISQNNLISFSDDALCNYQNGNVVSTTPNFNLNNRVPLNNIIPTSLTFPTFVPQNNHVLSSANMQYINQNYSSTSTSLSYTPFYSTSSPFNQTPSINHEYYKPPIQPILNNATQYTNNISGQILDNKTNFNNNSNEYQMMNSFKNMSVQPEAYPYNTKNLPSSINYNPKVDNINYQQHPPQTSPSNNYSYNRPVNIFQLSQIFPYEPEKPVAPSIPENLEPFNCPSEFVRCSLTTLPQTHALLDKVRLPLGIILHPFNDKQEIPLVTDQVMSRCKTCRTYINPFITLLDMRRWKCNICYRTNELPEEYYYDAQKQAYTQPYQRVELQNSAVEFVASSDYMIRPPQPTVYLFVLEVTTYAVSTGYLKVFCEVLSSSLEELPGDSRTMIGFLTFDQNIHFYRFRDDAPNPDILVCPDTEEPFLPCDGNLLVNLQDFKQSVSHFLTHFLPSLWDDNKETRNALGPALKVAQKLLAPHGGRLTILQATIPTVGCGALPNREDPNLRADQDVSKGLTPHNDFYKKMALDFTNDQVSADFFFLPYTYIDIATLATLSKFSGGGLHHFPSYHAENNPLQAERFEQCLKRYLTRDIGFEAVLRVRSSKGLTAQGFYGNFFLRSSNLLCLPTVKPDASYAVHYTIEEDLVDSSIVSIQSAILYTTSNGERRIRVLTLALPISNNFDDILSGADQEVVTSFIAVMAADRCLNSNLHQAREAMITAVQDYLSSFNKHAYISVNYSNLLSPQSCSLIPLFIHSLLKHVAFRAGVSTKLDDRAFSLYNLQTKPVESLLLEIYPHLYSINYLSSDEIKDSTNDNSKYCSYIPIQELSAKSLDQRSSYLLDVGEAYLIYVSKLTPSIVLQDIFGVGEYAKIDEDEAELNPNSKIAGFLDCLQNEKPYYVPFLVIKEDGSNRTIFRSYMIQDKSESSMSYHEFLLYIVKEITS